VTKHVQGHVRHVKLRKTFANADKSLAGVVCRQGLRGGGDEGGYGGQSSRSPHIQWLGGNCLH